MQYLFLSVPNFCGSTLLHSLIALSSSVVELPLSDMDIRGTREGSCYYKTAASIIKIKYTQALMEHLMRNPRNYPPMSEVKEIWDGLWESENPNALIRLQKSPHDIYRMQHFEGYFENLRWIISVRDPYEYVVSLRKRSNFYLEHLCEQAGRCLEIQAENYEKHQDRSYKTTYETVAQYPQRVMDEISTFMPDLGKIEVPTEISVKRSINPIKLERQIDRVPKEAIEIMTREFQKFKDAFSYWGYKFIEEQPTEAVAQ
jgi:hypothetical protein